jgi:hypothetical protein
MFFLSSGVGTTIHISGGDGRNQTFYMYPIAVSTASPYTGLHSQYLQGVARNLRRTFSTPSKYVLE